MAEPCTVIVGAPELHEALREHAGAIGEVLLFSEAEALNALGAIRSRRPRVVALERLFAATSRGAALMDRIKADRGLADVEIRIIARDGSYTRVSARRTSASAAGPPSATSGTEDAETSSAPAVNLDHTGTRRAPRFRMSDGTEAQVDGALAALVDLSSIGAQISSPASLKPAQVVRMMLADDLGMVRFSASVAWVSFEIPKGVSRYRAGVEFKGAETKAVEAFCARHKVRNVI